ncbi:uncharacterized protein PITG_00961 [Phytophthora infestans T30-4]|uniref:GATOR2 complex protein MIO zinc-ribbon like domain-containing protein n=1 Tax=Phytophthora infestans (strain T30-4) TaxID=403677 RepID=D0MS40_PHYIT|nr:uncharacterized protein PITG_00961 [Phytophthora infestans T30-4]EEY58309.1 conserved hypothetical protein [Phytophthora infestans T30-4]|eukprot:XP_002909495.1 conserved hypothetical protein [Phytophthora infestans T30-4]
MSEAVSNLVSSVAADNGGVLKEPKTGKNEYENLAQLSSIPFVEWFTWCQSCKHGGHAHHLADWFKAHTVCPVTDCNCQCQHLDLPIVGDDNQMQLIEQQRAISATKTRGKSVGAWAEEIFPGEATTAAGVARIAELAAQFLSVFCYGVGLHVSLLLVGSTSSY